MQPRGPRKVDWSKPGATQKLAARGEQSYRTKDGAQFKGILDETKTRNVPIGKITAGKKFWDIIPYAAGSQDPEVVEGRMQEGDPTYTVGVYVHRGVGPNQDRYICLAKTYKKPCPICEYRNDLSRDPDADENVIKDLRPSRYMSYLYNIWDRDAESKGIQVFEISGFFFEREIQAQAKSARGGGYIAFASPLAGPQGGRHISCEVNMKGQNQDWTGHKLEIRTDPIPNNILDSAYCLDELLHVPTYEEVSEAFFGSGGASPQEAEEEQTTETEQPPECFQTGEVFEECSECVYVSDCHPQQEEEPEPEPEPQPVAHPVRRPAPAIIRRPSSAPTPSGKTPLRRN